MKVVRHSHHEQFLRLANEDAALLVSSGRWVYTSKFEARKATQRPHRSVLARIGMFAAAALAVIALLVLSTSARAADKSVPKQPYKVCLNLQQAQQIHPGKKLRYREVSGEKCWYAHLGKTVAKSEFIPRSTSVASKPVRAMPQEAQRTQGSAGAVPAAGADYQAMMDDAFLALTGRPESAYTFDALWNTRSR